MGVVPDVQNMPNTEQFVRKAALDVQVSRLDAAAIFSKRTEAGVVLMVLFFGLRYPWKSFTLSLWWTSQSLASLANKMSMPTRSG